MISSAPSSARFREHVVERPADLLAARGRHDAIRARLAATLHHGQERAAARARRCGDRVELLDRGEGHVDDAGASRADLPDHRGQAVQRLRTEHEVDERRAFQYRGALLARDATADADDQVGALLFELAPTAEQREHLLLRLLAHGARVQQQHVRVLCRANGARIDRIHEDVGHLGRIVLVHLAAKGLDEETVNQAV